MNQKESTRPKIRRAGRSSQEIKQLLAAFEKSGSGAKEFCKSHDIGETTFQKWKSRYGKKKDAPVTEEGFISLQISPVAASGNMEGLFAEVKGIKLYQPVAASYLKELLQ